MDLGADNACSGHQPNVSSPEDNCRAQDSLSGVCRRMSGTGEKGGEGTPTEAKAGFVGSTEIERQGDTCQSLHHYLPTVCKGSGIQGDRGRPASFLYL